MTLSLKYKFFFALLISIGIYSCDGGNGNSSQEDSQNLDTIKITDEGNLSTGVSIKYEPLVLNIDTLQPPLKVKVGIPRVDTANKNVYGVNPPDIKLVASSLPTFTPGIGGIELPIVTAVIGVQSVSVYPQSHPAMAPSFRDNASYNLQYLEVDHGMSSSYIKSMIEDSRGNIWFSTWSSGVAMYDGNSFTTFREDNGLLADYIWIIFEDYNGNLWFGSDGYGLGMYDGNYFKYYNTDNGLAGDLVLDIKEDNEKNLWIATSEGLSKFDGKSFTSYTTSQGLSHNYTQSISIDNKNNIWIATLGGGVNKFDGESFIHYTEEEGLISNNCSNIFIDSEENIWIGTEGNGVCIYDGYSFFTYGVAQGMSSDFIMTIIEDSHGSLWFGTDGGGITRYNRSSFVHYTEQEGLSNNIVQTALEDSDGNLWFGTEGGGVTKYNEKSFKNYTTNQGLSDNIVRTIAEDRNGNLWFGQKNGVSKYNGKIFEHYGVDQGLLNPNIRSIIEDQNGDFWFATTGSGATKYDGEYFTHYTSENGMSHDVIHCIFEDSEGILWFGTHGGGITSFDGEIFSHFDVDQGGGLNTAMTIKEDSEGNILFGTTGGGVIKWDGNSLTHITKEEGLSGNYIYSLLEDSQGSLWFGMDGTGLDQMIDDEVFHYSIESGLTNEIVYSIIEDFDNNIWLSTENGINVISFDEEGDFQVTKFGKLDGLKGLDFHPNAVCFDNEGKIWWGSGKALIMLDLNKYERITQAPELRLTDLSIKQTFVDFRSVKDSGDFKDFYLTTDSITKINDLEFSNVSSFTNCPEDLVLPHNLNHLIFHFSAIDWSAPHKIRYKYKLEGLDDKWSPVLDEDYAIYSNLAYGDYVFKVRAVGEAELWSETIEYSFKINPPWWLTWWAYILYALLGSYILISVFKWRTRKLIDNQKKLERRIKERTVEVIHQKDLVERKNKEITDSITYAKRIQEAILPSHNFVRNHLENAFILYKPKDIVAGDFYWLEERDDKILLASADCTGHGVPGAMVSVVCNNALNRTVREFNLNEPAAILNKVREIVIETFSKNKEDVKDGMDIALISYDRYSRELQFAGANNSFYLFRGQDLKIIKADKQPIGTYAFIKPFTNHKIQLQKGDTFYIFTDGYVDQFGGPRGKKFKYAPFLDMLKEIQTMPLQEQKAYINTAFEEWKGDKEQIDDVCVIGIRI